MMCSGKNQQMVLPNEVVYFISIITGVLSLCGIVGNIVIVATVCYGSRYSRLFKIFILQVCIANILLVTISYPLFTRHMLWCVHAPVVFSSSDSITVVPPYAEFFCGLCIVGIMLLSILRYRKIVYSMCLRTEKQRTQHVIMAIWVGTFLVVIIPKVFQTSTIFASHLFQKIYPFLFWYVFPALLTCFTYVKTKVFSNCRMATEWGKGSGHTALVTNIVLRRKRSVRMVGPMALTAICLTFPLNGGQILSVFAQWYIVEHQNVFAVTIMFCLVLNAFLLPLIQFKLSLEVRKDLTKLYKALKKHMTNACYKLNGGKPPNGPPTCVQSHSSRPVIFVPHLQANSPFLTNGNVDDDINDFVMSEKDINEIVKLIGKEPSTIRESVL